MSKEQEMYEYALANQLAQTAPYFGGGQIAGSGLGGISLVSMRKEIELKIVALRKQLEIQEQMLKLLEENPAIEKFMNLSRGIL